MSAMHTLTVTLAAEPATLVYLATTERYSIRLRSNVRGEDVRLYRLDTPPEQARALLLEYASQSTTLAKQPQWYNSITANCAKRSRSD